MGQIIHPEEDEPIAPITVKLSIIDEGASESKSVDSTFLYPHEIKRNPPFRFLDLVNHYQMHGEQAEAPPEKRRQDGVYLFWDTERIAEELTDDQQERYQAQLEEYSPFLYAFVPYQGSVWRDLNLVSTRRPQRSYLYPGLMVAVNRQRLADIFEIRPSRFETFSRNVFVAVHLHGARPDHGRKTIDAESMQFAQRVADRVVQYLAKQRPFLRPPGESPTPEQRQIEKDHRDWIFNVRTHHQKEPLHNPPIAYISTPLTEQDVVGLFHQLCALGVFAGAKVYSTSQSKTYDCLMDYDCPIGTPGLAYSDTDQYPLGVSPYTLGDGDRDFETKELTVEFKNNLDGLIADIERDGSPKQFDSIDICVCWSKV